MATLPQADIDLSQGVVFQDQPSLTWIADPATHRLRGRGDNYEAVRQAVEIIVNVERFHWQIYTPKRTCRITIGTSTAGWTQADCDYLCDGTDDQVELNAAIQAVYAKGGGEVAVLGGEYNLSAAWDIQNTTEKQMCLTFSGEPGASVLNLASDIYMGGSTRASLRFFGLTFCDGDGIRLVGSQDIPIAFDACTFLNVKVDLDGYNGVYILFRGNEMEFSNALNDNALNVETASTTGALIDGNSIHAATSQLPGHAEGRNAKYLRPVRWAREDQEGVPGADDGIRGGPGPGTWAVPAAGWVY